MTEPSPRPLTRRELRLAERNASLAAPSPRQPGGTPAPRERASVPGRHTATDLPAVRPTVPDEPVVPAPRRRDLRQAAHAQPCPPPFTVVRPVPGTTVPSAGPSRASRRRAVRPDARRPSGLAAKGLVTIALSGALVVSGLSYTNTTDFEFPGYATAAQVKATERAAQIDARLAAERSVQASATRLTGQANAYAAAKRVDALAQAEATLVAAASTADGAEEVLGADGVAVLEQAVDQLSTLVAKAPAPAVASPVDGVDEERRVQTSRTAAAGASAPEAEAGQTEGAARTPAAAAETPASRPEAPTTEPTATPAPVTPVDDDADVPQRRTGANARPVEVVEPADTAPSSTSALLALDAETLDLEVTTQLLAAVAQVDALSQEVTETAAETLEAQEAARVAAEKAAAERARKVGAAQSAANGAIPAEVLCAVDFEADARLRCDAAEALEELNQAYRAAFGRDLRISSTYRSYSAQVATKASRGSLAASPGTSNHGHAVAVDFADFGAVGQFSGASYRWMREHAGAYGWIHPRIMQPGGGGPQEPWHWEYGTE